ncbi:MAG: serine hydrolase domain-containing protein, partial [Planctomycetota bacterium]
RYLPRFQLADAELAARISVRDLLCHRPGLNSFGAVTLDAYTGEISEERYYHFLALERGGGGVAYSNVHFTLAGRVIEAVSGKSWRDWLAAEVFAPAGMSRSSGYAERMYAEDDAALPSVFQAGRISAAPLRKSDRTMHAAGGLGLSLEDGTRWLRVQLGRGELEGRRLLGAAATEATWALQSQLKDDGGFGVSEGFGLGWQRGSYRGQLELSHGGGYVGAASYFCFLPELELGLVFLASGDFGAGALLRLMSSDVHERLLADDAERDVLPQLRERLASERKREGAAAEAARAARGLPLELGVPLERCAGTFHNEWFGTLAVRCADGGLAARLGDLALDVRGLAGGALQFASPGSVDTTGKPVLAGGEVVAYELDLAGEAVRFTR